MHKSTLLSLLAAWACLLPSTADTFEGGASPPIERKVIQRSDIPGTDEELEMVLATFPPGAQSSPHLHPVVGLNYILEGSAESQYEGEELKVYSAGQSYQDLANVKHLVFRNKSQEKPLRFLIAFRIKKGASFRIDLAEPQKGGVHLEKTDSIHVNKKALFPEGIAYNPKTGKFLLGSFREGAVYEVSPKGETRLLVDDPRLSSVLGLSVDTQRNRLLVANSDLGAAVRPYSGGPQKLASLAIYDLSTGKSLNFVDLGRLLPGKAHLANDLALDTQGNAYITDSLSPVIYKVTPTGEAAVFLESDQFRAKGIGLNGIVFHPDGFLIVTKKDDGSLFKVPLEAPKTFTKIGLSEALPGSDGLVLANKDDLIMICNKTPDASSNVVLSIQSDDHWQTARVIEKLKTDDVYPTTGTIRDGKLYVVHSKLNELISAPKADQGKLSTSPTIEELGSVRKAP